MDMDQKKKYQTGQKGGKSSFVKSLRINRNRQINEEDAPQNQDTEQDYQVGIGSDLKPMNGEPVPPEGINPDDL